MAITQPRRRSHHLGPGPCPSPGEAHLDIGIGIDNSEQSLLKACAKMRVQPGGKTPTHFPRGHTPTHNRQVRRNSCWVDDCKIPPRPTGSPCVAAKASTCPAHSICVASANASATKFSKSESNASGVSWPGPASGDDGSDRSPITASASALGVHMYGQARSTCVFLQLAYFRMHSSWKTWPHGNANLDSSQGMGALQMMH